VAGGQVGFLLEHVLVLGVLRGVLDLPHPGTLSGVRDVFDLLLADVACGLVRAHRRVDQRNRALDAGVQQHRGQKPRIHHRPRPLRNPRDGMPDGVGAQFAPGLCDRDRAGGASSCPSRPCRSSVAATAGS